MFSSFWMYFLSKVGQCGNQIGQKFWEVQPLLVQFHHGTSFHWNRITIWKRDKTVRQALGDQRRAWHPARWLRRRGASSAAWEDQCLLQWGDDIGCNMLLVIDYVDSGDGWRWKITRAGNGRQICAKSCPCGSWAWNNGFGSSGMRPKKDVKFLQTVQCNHSN